MTIYLGPRLLGVSSDLTRPAFVPNTGTNLNGLFLSPLWNRRSRHSTGRKRNLFGLAPGGVYPAIPITRNTGELLPHLFTLTHRDLCLGGGMFSVALSLPPVKWRLRLLHRGQSVLRTTLPCGARTFLPFRLSASRELRRSGHPFPFDPPLLF